jgi:putative N6-adenine-specific DNA methylase
VSYKPAPKKSTPGKPASKKAMPSKDKFNKSLPAKVKSKTQPNKVALNKVVSSQLTLSKPTPEPTAHQATKPSIPLTPRGLERRLKRHLLKESQEFFAVCTPGFEAVVAKELLNLSSSPVPTIKHQEPGGITFSAPLETLYHANLHLRTAHRVLLRIDEFLAQSYPMLFNKVKKILWELFLGFNKTYTLHVSAKESRLHQHKTIAKTIHDGVSEYMKQLGLSPQLSDNAAIDIHARFFQDRCTLSVNTSGEHLHKRGYRQLVSTAPIRETLAASILYTVDIQSFETILDPMCGSGTLLIEAALLLKNIAPGLQREFAFETLPFFQKSKWERFKREAAERQQKITVNLLGFDIDAKNIEIAKANAVKAGVSDLIHFESADARTLHLSAQGKSLIVCNVPYGERLESTVLNPFAKNLQQHFRGWHVAFVTKELSWLNTVELETKQRFQNGGLGVYLVTGRS